MGVQFKVENLQKVKEALEKLIKTRQITFFNEYFNEILYLKGLSIKEDDQANVLEIVLDKEGATISLDS